MGEVTDRALDALVAETVIVKAPRIPRNAAPLLCSLALHPVPPYSTDIAAAFLVVEEMRRRGWRYTLRDARNRDGFCHEAQFDNHKGVLEFEQDTTSPSRAICIAALRALGVETPEEEGDSR